MIILEGYEISKGSFETGKVSVDKSTGEIVQDVMEYNNIILYYRSNEKSGSNGPVKGWFCESVKAKADAMQVYNAKSIDECLGKQVIFGFDMTQRADNTGKVKQTVTSVVLVGGK